MIDAGGADLADATSEQRLQAVTERSKPTHAFGERRYAPAAKRPVSARAERRDVSPSILIRAGEATELLSDV